MSALLVKPIPTLIHYTRSFEYMMVMKLQSVKLNPTRNWRNKNFDLVVERDKNRKKSQQSVDERIHYMWFNYLQLCLDLESINHSVPKRGGRGKIISTTKVKVSKSIYKDWDLEKVKKSSFSEWYKDKEHRLLFYDGGFRYTRGTQYHPLVKRFNVFILYHNMMNGAFIDDTGGTKSKGMRVSELIMEDLQKRYELIERDDIRYGQGTDTTPSSVQKRVLKDVVECGNTILAVCEGRFPK